VSLLLAVLLPLAALALVTQGGRAAAWGRRLAVLAPLASLVPLVAGERVEWGWALLGVALGAEAWLQPFVILTALGWSAAGLFALDRVEGDARRFWQGWTASLAGMVLALFAQTLVTFYLGYVVVSLAAYLLIVHVRTEQAWRAGRIYLLLALVGEAAIISGATSFGNVALPLVSTSAEAPAAEAARWLLLVGFAAKLGIVPLHMWLPLAHPIAPVPASAILSGVIVKAGLLGWLKLAPPQGPEALTGASVLVAIGLVTAFAGVLLGLTQAKLKTVLAYSTISQMGLVLVGFAAFSMQPADDRWLAALGLLALHHGLTKGSLFLACGCAPGASRARQLLLALPALSLAAAPLTTGFLAKAWLKRGVAAGIELGHLPGVTEALLSLTSTATALLMWRLWVLAQRERDAAAGVHPAWPLLTLLALSVPWLWASHVGLLVTPTVESVWAAIWPLLVAAGIVTAAARLGRPGVRLPEGDVVVLFERAAARVPAPPLAEPQPAGRATQHRAAWGRVVGALESAQRDIPMVGLVMLLVGALVSLVLYVG